MECICFLAHQGLAFRDNDNLAQLFKLVNMHNDIQNKLIELMAQQVLAKNLESIHSSKFFGIIADKYTDISNKELLSM